MANTTIAFIDMDRIMSDSKPGLSILKQLKNINNKNANKLQNDFKKLKEQEIKLISQKKILSKSDFQSSANKLKSEVENYNISKDKINNEFTKLKVDSTNKLLILVNPILIKYSNEKSISIILQKKNIIMGKTELDITDEIIMIIDNIIDEFKIK
jgi:outer membrane protein